MSNTFKILPCFLFVLLTAHFSVNGQHNIYVDLNRPQQDAQKIALEIVTKYLLSRENELSAKFQTELLEMPELIASDKALCDSTYSKFLKLELNIKFILFPKNNEYNTVGQWSDNLKYELIDIMDKRYQLLTK